MLEYTEANRQQLIVRQSSMDRAVQILIAKGLIKENETQVSEVVTKVRQLTDVLENVIRTPKA